jgi:hypothetical protein
MKSKRLTEISKIDLLQIPVWEYWMENEIEFISPTDAREIKEMSPKTYIVLTNFKLANGIELIGFCSPQDKSGLDYTQPVILTENGLFVFWRNNDWTIAEKEKELKKIGLRWNEIFPVEFETIVMCDNEFYKSKILDFNTGNKTPTNYETTEIS